MSWPLKTLDEIFEIARGGSPRPIDQFITDADDGVNWIMIGDASNSSKHIRQTKKKIIPSGVSRSRLVKPGDFLLTNSMSFGRPYILDTNGCIHDGWLVLSPRRANVDHDYFYHLLGSPAIFGQFEKLAAGATVKNLNIDSVKSVVVALPPLEDQKRIAAILDQADELRRKRQRALDRLSQLGQAIFIEMFGDPASNPKGWPVGTVRDLLDEAKYGTSAKANTDGVGLPMLRMGNLTFDGKIDLSNLKHVELSEDEFDKYTTRPGDILFNRTNSKELVGKTAVVTQEEPLAIAGYLVRARANERGNPHYISAYLNSLHGKATLRNMCKNIVGMANINAQELQNIAIALPPRPIQDEFALRLTSIEIARRPIIASQSKAESLFTSLQARAFRGEL